MSHAFEHACRSCTRTFSPQLDLSQNAVLTAHCPHCGYAHGYDNRQGRLQKLLLEKIQSRGRMIPSASAAFEEKKIPEAVSAPLITETPATTLTQETAYEESDTQFDAYAYDSTASIYSFSSTAAHDVQTHAPVIAEPQKPRRSLLAYVKTLSLKKIAVVSGLTGFVFVVALAVLQAIAWPSEDAQQALAGLKARQADAVLDRNGLEINRLGVSQALHSELADFHEWQIAALLFSEDRGFYEHHGVEYSAIVRALANNVLHFRYAQGASTITQQLARIILQNRKKSIFRKLQEVRLARALENVLSKQKILTFYVNNVYLGHGNYSFASASRFYYGKTIKELSANEFISLVALIPSPEKYSPLKNNRILQARMQKLYAGMVAAKILPLSAEDWAQGMASVTEQASRFASETAFGEKSRLGLWPAQYAREYLTQRKILSGENQNSARVFTTIDIDSQTRAEELLQKHLARARKNFRAQLKSQDSDAVRLRRKLSESVFDAGLLLDMGGFNLSREAAPQLQAALIAIQPQSGEILAMVGGESFESKNQLNRTIQMRRQVGSAIKPFIYAKALSLRLIHAASLIDDTPYIAGSGAKIWAPENINGGFEGPMPARDALAKSRNIPAIRVGRLVGRDGITELFSDFFFQNETTLGERFAYDETVAIGTISLSPLEMVRAFSVFANSGFLNNPLLITRVENSDRIVDFRKTHANQFSLTEASKDRLLSAAETQLMISLLKSSGANAGTGVEGIVGKTGTSSDSRDLWFVGGGKDIIVAVWFGFDDMRYSIPGATGSALSSKLAGDFLRKKFAPLEFKLQHGMQRLRVCALSGRIASENCPHARGEIFLSGKTPQGECLHGSEAQFKDTEFAALMGDSQFW